MALSLEVNTPAEAAEAGPPLSEMVLCGAGRGAGPTQDRELVLRDEGVHCGLVGQVAGAGASLLLHVLDNPVGLAGAVVVAALLSVAEDLNPDTQPVNPPERGGEERQWERTLRVG